MRAPRRNALISSAPGRRGWLTAWRWLCRRASPRVRSWAVAVGILFAWLGLLVPIGLIPKGSRWYGLAWALWLTSSWLGVTTVWWYSRSLRDDERARDAAIVADVIGEPIPAHPPWWRDQFRLLGRDMQVWPVVLAAVVGVMCAALLGPLPARPASWLVALFFVWLCILYTGMMASWLGVRGARRRRVTAFKDHVYAQLAATGVTGLRTDRQQLLVDIARLERQLDTKRAELAALEAGTGVEKVTSEHIIASLKSYGADSERRNRRWEVMLAIAFLLPSAFASSLVGVVAGSFFHIR
jgi:hypothetical protein